MKKIFSLFLALIVVISLFSPVGVASSSIPATVTTSSLELDGHPIRVQGFNIQGSNYFKLRDLAAVFAGTASEFNVVWNGGKNAIEIKTGEVYSHTNENDSGNYYYSFRTYSAKPNPSKIYVNGQLIDITAYNIDGSNYFKLRDLGALIPFEVTYDGKNNHISLLSQVPEHAYRVKTDFSVLDNTVSAVHSPWKTTVSSHLIRNDDHTFSVVTADEKLMIETYNAKFELVSSNSVEYELPIFGAFYSGEVYNYVAFGQNNIEENDQKEVIRVVRYDKNFNRVDSVSVTGGESFVTEPFSAAAGRMAEHEDTLVFHTSRTRYTSEDGLNHQSQLTLIIDTQEMKVKNGLGLFQANHVSHSFDQYVLFDGNKHVLLDHGDAFPRSIVLNKDTGIVDDLGAIIYNDPTRVLYATVDLFDIPGMIGDNWTGVSVGGFEMSATHYITAMNTVDHSKVSQNSYFFDPNPRDIMIVTVPRDDLTKEAVKQIRLAKYIDTDQHVSVPQLVKINDEQFLVLWEEFDDQYHAIGLKYVWIDGEGRPVGEIQTKRHFKLSNSQPIVFGNDIVWFVDTSAGRLFYTLPLEFFTLKVM